MLQGRDPWKYVTWRPPGNSQGPRSHHDGPKTHRRRFQDASRTAQGAPQNGPRRPKDSPRRLQEASRSFQNFPVEIHIIYTYRGTYVEIVEHIYIYTRNIARASRALCFTRCFSRCAVFLMLSPAMDENGRMHVQSPLPSVLASSMSVLPFLPCATPLCSFSAKPCHPASPQVPPCPLLALGARLVSFESHV